LLSQKAGIKRQQAELIKYGEDEERERAEARTRARERVLRDFQRGMGLGGPNGTSKEVRALDTPGEDRGTKRKFEFDHDQVERIALEAEEKAMKAIEAEQVRQRYWLG
jgi:nitric oxide synthase-interacting protein